MTVTVVDLFCGAGGSSTGLVDAGYEVVVAANHSRIAIETHAANHPNTEHLCEDISRYDMRHLPRTRGLWASPICTEISPAGGRRRRRETTGQTTLDGIPGPHRSAAFERTRATAYDVIRATEVHRYDFVLCENVVEWVTDWELFDWWRTGMHTLGYTSQIVSFNSAHVGDDQNPHAPQWRDRIYVVFVRNGIRRPDLTLQPRAWCTECREDVESVQAWRNGHTVGKYRQQYDYRCPHSSCRHSIVHPYVRPAAAVIDWADLGQRIGDRKPTATKPEGLSPKTMARIRRGAAMITQQPETFMVNLNHDWMRAYLPADGPMPTRSTRTGDGIASPPFQVPCGGTWNDRATVVAEPMRTRTANEMEGLAIPDTFITMLRNHTRARHVREPFATFAADGQHHALVVPYYRTGTAKPAVVPMDTITTLDRFGLSVGQAELDISDWRFRMLKPREALTAQRFPADYIIHGTGKEQTAQAGNAVSVNVARWIGERVLQVL